MKHRVNLEDFKFRGNEATKQPITREPNKEPGSWGGGAGG